MAFIDFLKDEKSIVMFALVLIIILGLISYNLYFSSNLDILGKEYDCFDTIRNIFDMLPIIGEVTDMLEKGVDSVQEQVENIVKEVPKITKRKEVFNIDNNDFTFEQAGLVCKAYDSELATYDQMISAHNKGANWCNYGWSAGGLALFPTQKKIYDKLQEGDDKYKKSCGKPGINGGKFENSELKFGVNCYGYRPEPDKNKIVYNSTDYPIPEMQKDANLQQEKIDELKRQIKNGSIELRPFSNKKWSKYSYKNSSYMLTPKSSSDDEIEVVEIQTPVDEETKNPLMIDSEELDIEDVMDGNVL
jgi:hypothetical protein